MKKKFDLSCGRLCFHLCFTDGLWAESGSVLFFHIGSFTDGTQKAYKIVFPFVLIMFGWVKYE